jgi:hypothetical protein
VMGGRIAGGLQHQVALFKPDTSPLVGVRPGTYRTANIDAMQGRMNPARQPNRRGAGCLLADLSAG